MFLRVSFNHCKKTDSDESSLSIWLFLYLWTFGRYNFCHDNKMGWFPSDLGEMFTKYINKTCDGHALTLLAACYLPGVLAAYLQLIRGTKYSWFPSWLDNWLKMRKQLGLLMLFAASIHVQFLWPRSICLIANVSGLPLRGLHVPAVQ